MNATRKRVLVFITAAACVATAGTAWGDGFRRRVSATTTTVGRTATVAGLSAAATADGRLSPGHSIAAAATLANPNDFPVEVTGIDDLVVTTAPGQPHSTCNAATGRITLTSRSNTGIPAGARTRAVPLTVTMGRTAAAACVGSVLNLTFTITADVGARGARPAPAHAGWTTVTARTTLRVATAAPPAAAKDHAAPAPPDGEPGRVRGPSGAPADPADPAPAPTGPAPTGPAPAAPPRSAAPSETVATASPATSPRTEPTAGPDSQAPPGPSDDQAARSAQAAATTGTPPQR